MRYRLRQVRPSVLRLLCLLLFFNQQSVLAETASPGLSAREFALANIEFSVLHELGHLLIDEFYIPILGKEEDIADRIGVIATYLMNSNLDDPAFAQRLMAILYNWQIEWQLANEGGEKLAYWDAHPLEIQRFFDIVCLLYGSNPDNQEEFRVTTGLPHERAMYCEREYHQAKRGLVWLANTFGNPENMGGSPLRSRITVNYQRSFVEGSDEINALVKESGILEKIAQRVSAVYRLPRDITINLTGCGLDDAYWNPVSAQIVLCHELVNVFLQRGERWQAQNADSIPHFNRSLPVFPPILHHRSVEIVP